MPWTNIAKPTSSVYSNVNPQGKEQYDQASIEYDDADIFYDGLNESLYTNVNKPSATTYTNIAKP